MSEVLVLLDYGRGKYHVPALRRSPQSSDHPACDPWGMPHPYKGPIKFEDEVAPEDICKRCLKIAGRR